ncbi:hypothetical protein F4809DRAFT_252585 [Biscogniauxia mediterranea]|nr:hypothetical protein F4809DRAFT_252585 [Biscogniauxia mediterranea]
MCSDIDPFISSRWSQVSSFWENLRGKDQQSAGSLKVVHTNVKSVAHDEDEQCLQQYDVVSVPGLGGMSNTQDSDNDHKSMSWVKDVLPGQIPCVRVMYFTYHLNLEDGISASEIERHAIGLLRGLQNLELSNVNILPDILLLPKHKIC